MPQITSRMMSPVTQPLVKTTWTNNPGKDSCVQLSTPLEETPQRAMICFVIHVGSLTNQIWLKKKDIKGSQRPTVGNYQKSNPGTLTGMQIDVQKNI